MPLHTETRAGGTVHILVDDNGRIVSHSEVRNGVAYYYSATGEVLEQHPIMPPRRWMCTACGCRCEAAGYMNHPDPCHSPVHQSNWIEILTDKTEV